MRHSGRNSFDIQHQFKFWDSILSHLPNILPFIQYLLAEGTCHHEKRIVKLTGVVKLIQAHGKYTLNILHKGSG